MGAVPWVDAGDGHSTSAGSSVVGGLGQPEGNYFLEIAPPFCCIPRGSRMHEKDAFARSKKIWVRLDVG